jgi:UDP-N-acetylglucosamine acyltransferase
MSADIHPAAIVSPKARLGQNVKIGPFSIIEEDVEIGDGTHIMPHVTIFNGARIGNECRIYPGAVIAAEPQDLKFKGEPTQAVIGHRTVVRECATINRGTGASGKAIVGSDCLIMAYCHVAHDCVVGNNVIMSNVAQLAGHVTLGDWVILGGMAKVVQFCTVGSHAMVGADCKITKDVLPYSLIGRDPSKVEGVNKVGLRRRGFQAEVIQSIDEFFTHLFFAGFNTTDALAAYKEQHQQIIPEIQLCIDFINNSRKGIIR